MHAGNVGETVFDDSTFKRSVELIFNREKYTLETGLSYQFYYLSQMIQTHKTRT